MRTQFFVMMRHSDDTLETEICSKNSQLTVTLCKIISVGLLDGPRAVRAGRMEISIRGGVQECFFSEEVDMYWFAHLKSMRDDINHRTRGVIEQRWYPAAHASSEPSLFA